MSLSRHSVVPLHLLPRESAAGLNVPLPLCACRWRHDLREDPEARRLGECITDRCSCNWRRRRACAGECAVHGTHHIIDEAMFVPNASGLVLKDREKEREKEAEWTKHATWAIIVEK